MCFATCLSVVAVFGLRPFRTATLESCGVQLEAIPLMFDEDVRPGDRVLVHLGIAIAVYDEAAAQETLQHLEELDHDQNRHQVKPRSNADEQS